MTRKDSFLKVAANGGLGLVGLDLLLLPYCQGGPACSPDLAVEALGTLGGVLALLGTGLMAVSWLRRQKSRVVDWRLLGHPRFVQMQQNQWPEMKDGIIDVEKASFKSEIRETPSYLEDLVKKPRSIFVVALVKDRVVGYACGGPLEEFGHIPGVKEDLHYGLGDTFYITSFAVVENLRGRGIGKGLMRALALRLKNAGFRFMSAHMLRGMAESWNGTPLESYSNWYGTGETFEYFRRELSFGDWVDGCKSMLLVEATLTGFSAALLAFLVPSISLGTLVQVSLVLVAASAGMFAFSAEVSTDALDWRSLTTYASSLRWYNFATAFLLAGVAFLLFQLSYGTGALPTNVVFVAFRGVALFLGALVCYVWLWDGLWLMFSSNRIEWALSQEFGEAV